MRDARTSGADIAESAAIAASLLCLAHCLFIPLTIAVLPMLSDALRMPEPFHAAILIFAAPTALFALVLGYRHHRRKTPLLLGITGIALLWAALAWPGLETALTTAGSAILITAHIKNWHRRHMMRR